MLASRPASSKCVDKLVSGLQCDARWSLCARGRPCEGPRQHSRTLMATPPAQSCTLERNTHLREQSAVGPDPCLRSPSLQPPVSPVERQGRPRAQRCLARGPRTTLSQQFWRFDSLLTPLGWPGGRDPGHFYHIPELISYLISRNPPGTFGICSSGRFQQYRVGERPHGFQENSPCLLD